MRGKQIIAFFLAVCMFAGFLPIAPDVVTASAAGFEQEFIFEEACKTAASQAWEEVAATIAEDGWELNSNNTKGYVNSENPYSLNDITVLGVGSVSLRNDVCMDVRMPTPDIETALSINVDIEKEAYYDFYIGFRTSSQGVTVDVFLNGVRMSTIDTSGADGVIVLRNATYLPAGTNEIRFERVDTDAEKFQFELQSIEFRNGFELTESAVDDVIIDMASAANNPVVSPITDASIDAGDSWQLCPDATRTVASYKNAVTSVGNASNNIIIHAEAGAQYVEASMGANGTTSIFSLEINVPTAGTYDFSVVDVLRHNVGPEVAVYVNREYVGVINSFRDGASVWGTYALNKVYLEAGINHVSFATIGDCCSTTKHNRFVFKQLRFTNGVTYGNNFVYSHVAFDFDTERVLDIGGVYDINVGVRMSNGVYRYMNGIAYTGTSSPAAETTDNTASVTSSDPSVASVAISGVDNNGLITYKLTAHKSGFTDITFNLQYKPVGAASGGDRSITKRVYVLREEADNDSQFVIDFDNEWKKAVYWHDMKPDSKTGEPVYYAIINGENPVYKPNPAFTESALALNPDMTHPDVLIKEDGTFGTQASHQNAVRIQPGNDDVKSATLDIRLDKGNDATFDIYVPSSGIYQLDFDLFTHASGGEFAVFMNEEFVGTLDGYSATTMGNGSPATIYLGNLNAGENHLTFRNVDNAREQITIFEMVFKKTEEQPELTFKEIDLEADKIAMSPGGTIELTFSAIMSDDSINNCDEYIYNESYADTDTVSVAAENASLVTISGEYDAFEQDTVTITAGDTEGYTRVTVTYTVNNEEKSASVPVYVIDNAWYNGYSTEQKIFGTSYYYLNQNEVDGVTTYTLVLLGAIDDLDAYRRVGFKVESNYIGGELKFDDFETRYVYEYILVNDTKYTAESFGLTEDDYIFYYECELTADMLSDGKTLSFSAYAKTQDDVEIKGPSIAIKAVNY